MQGGCRTSDPQQPCYIFHFIDFRVKIRYHISKIVFYSNQIQSNFILRGARTLLLVLMPFPPPLDCQYILRFKHACFLPSPSSFMRPLPNCILCSQGASYSDADCVCPVHVRSQLNVLKCMFLFFRIKWFQVFLFIFELCSVQHP
ncbi:hypothetical protein C0J52_25357 [Blattella germanica]|nr:hypothetical protein C0J52_25357 [Blattella germanica]